MANKVKYGLSNCYYAVYDETAGTYGTPVAMPGAVNLSLDQEGETNKFRADNIDYYVSISNNGYSGDLDDLASGVESYFSGKTVQYCRRSLVNVVRQLLLENGFNHIMPHTVIIFPDVNLQHIPGGAMLPVISLHVALHAVPGEI